MQVSTAKKRTAAEAGISRIEQEPPVKVFKKDDAPSRAPRPEPGKKVNFIALNKQRIAQKSVDAKTRAKTVEQEVPKTGLLTTIKTKLGCFKPELKTSVSKEELAKKARSRSANSVTTPVDHAEAGEALQQNFNLLNLNQKPAKIMTPQKFLYEPPLVSSRMIRLWEQRTNQKWYNLSPQSRSQMNRMLSSQNFDAKTQ